MSSNNVLLFYNKLKKKRRLEEGYLELNKEAHLLPVMSYLNVKKMYIGNITFVN